MLNKYDEHQKEMNHGSSHEDDDEDDEDFGYDLDEAHDRTGIEIELMVPSSEIFLLRRMLTLNGVLTGIRSYSSMV